ncbi:MAG: MFS transporter [Desulfobacteraceae bacterium]|nr:MFS transporter [Desulfobacteraceae bacterium]
MTKKSPLSIPNIRLFIMFRVFFNSRFYYPVFTILFLDFGLTMSQFALLNAAWAASIVFAEVPSGALADIIGRRKLLVATGLLMVAEMLIICFAPRSNPTILFIAFLANRILSGMAEAAASGADEALAYDSLKRYGNTDDWGSVIEMQMRWKSIAFIVAMSVGAAVYDPALMQGLSNRLGFDLVITQAVTLRIPLFMTLVMAVLTLATTLSMKEVHESETGTHTPGADKGESVTSPPASSAKQAFAMTLKAGRWILSTPAALVLIFAGLTFDGISRMVITLSSQYYRLVNIPEALFGLIGAAMALLGLVVPRLAYRMSERFSPGFNFIVVAILSLAGLWGMSVFMPIWGLLPALVLFSTMYLTGFFISDYLNKMTSSDQRATVLSFKGLSFNLFYGIVGILYSVLLAHTRTSVTGADGMLTEQATENIVFIKSFTWFPWSLIIMIVVVVVFSKVYPTRQER